MSTIPTFTRRHLLGGSLVTAFGAESSPRWAVRARTSAAEHTVVFVFLRGGPDGCSIVVPASDAAYFDSRPTIAVDDAAVIALDDTFGLHPAMAPLRELWQDGQLAVVPACGSTLDSRSHFSQQAHIERGGVEGATDGWMTRLLALTGTGSGPFDAVAMGAGVPASLAGATSVVAVDGLDAVALPRFGATDTAGVATLLRSGAAGFHPLLATATDGALAAIPVLQQVATTQPADADSTGMATTFGDLARILRADVGIDVATVDIGGWDTHDAMGDASGGRMTDLVTTLATALAAFADALGPGWSRTTVVAVGEFGRRVAENGSGGTDHGRGGVLLAMGGAVRGGRYGDWPGLSSDALVAGDVPVTTDWRTAVAEVLERRLGVDDIGTVFPDLGSARLGIVT